MKKTEQSTPSPQGAEHNAERREGPYYMLRGFDANGRQFVTMPIFAASAGLEVVKANALGMLQDGGYDCASADAIDMPKTNSATPRQSGNEGMKG